MKIKKKIAIFICKLLNVEVVPNIIKKISIQSTNIADQKLDLSSMYLSEKFDLDISNTNITTVHFPSNKISGKTTIEIHLDKDNSVSSKNIGSNQIAVIHENDLPKYKITDEGISNISEVK